LFSWEILSDELSMKKAQAMLHVAATDITRFCI